MPNDVTLPASWTLAYVAWMVVVIAIVAFGIFWTLRKSPRMTATAKAGWIALEILLPVVGFVIWAILLPSKTDSSAQASSDAEQRPVQDHVGAER